jgi:hypothetical protein
MRTYPIYILLFLGLPAAKGQDLPSREAFVNEVFLKLGNQASSYYLVAGSDTCRFEKFDYDEWVKYHLQEDVPLSTLNELSYKVHVGQAPYYWQQDKMKKAMCITVGRADSLLALPGSGGVFSFSQPQFTDDGQYAVIDINWKNGLITGSGYTFLYRHARDGWQRIGSKHNWGSGE